MGFNFHVASKKEGDCILRFDDTNPEAEKQIYIDNVIANVEWMGHKPSAITYSSDYFDELYQMAIKLVKSGKAYVCHMSGDEIKASRETHTDSP
jgi:glutaminyl-tRNA synthetase